MQHTRFRASAVSCRGMLHAVPAPGRSDAAVQVISTVPDESESEASSRLGEIVGVTSVQDYIVVAFEIELQLWSAKKVCLLVLSPSLVQLQVGNMYPADLTEPPTRANQSNTHKTNRLC